MMMVFALLESVIAVVAAIALAVLNYIFVSQRQSEFGVLHALGYGRLQLVWRTVRETLFTTGVAWGFSAFLFLMGLVYLQCGVFEPLGLRLDFLNLTPWLYTLPIPVAVLAVTTGTTARTLSKLDPVTIIERRSAATGAIPCSWWASLPWQHWGSVSWSACSIRSWSTRP